MKKNLSILLIALGLLGCSLFTPRATSSPQVMAPTAAASLNAPQVLPTPTPLPTLPPVAPTLDPATVPTADLVQALASQFPPDTYGGFQVIPLAPPAGSPPLWAAFSTGLRSFTADTLPSHFVALETHDDGGWHELTRINLDQTSDGGGPDYLDPTGVRQVLLEPGHLWLLVEGGIGAHSGIFDLLMYDGQQLVLQALNANSSPAAGELKDVNADGIQEVILNRSDPYVFTYAAGVHKPDYGLLRWDTASQRLVEVTLQPLPQDAPAEIREPVNAAVALGQAGLWKDAQATLDSVPAPTGLDASAADTYTWDAALVQIYASSISADLVTSAFPLIVDVFYGDYPAAVDLLRPYPVEDLFSPQPSFLQDSVASGFESSLSAEIIACAGQAIAARPDLAPAYFLRGWAAYLANPQDPQARADLTQAAQLAPQDELFTGAAAYLP